MKILQLFVLCFIFNCSITAQLVDNNDGTITDYASHLMWLKDPLTSGEMNWSEAQTWVEELQTAGYSDWRLPENRGQEVISLRSYYTEMESDEPFANLLPGGLIWSSSVHELSGEPYAVLLRELDINHYDPDHQGYAWAVRDISASETIDIDLWIKDSWNDRGNEPSGRSGQSWDIYIDNNYDGKIDLPNSYTQWQAQLSYRNKVYVYVRNNSNAYVQAWVNLYVHYNQDEMFSDQFKQGARESVYIHPNSRELVIFDNNSELNNYEIRLRTLYTCTELNQCDIMGVAIHHEFDPVTEFLNNPPYDPQMDNNVATLSLDFLDRNMVGKDASLSWRWNFRFRWFALLIVVGFAIWSIERYLVRNYYRRYFSKNP